jgi:hypothetical protein
LDAAWVWLLGVSMPGRHRAPRPHLPLEHPSPGRLAAGRLAADGGYAIGALAEMTCVLLRPVSLA